MVQSKYMSTWYILLAIIIFIIIPESTNHDLKQCMYIEWRPTPVLLPGKSHGRRSLVGCSPWGCYELDTTERLHFHFSLSCIGEGNGNPLQCSCLENPREGGAWWAAVCGVPQSRTRLKQLSSMYINHHHNSRSIVGLLILQRRHQRQRADN